jgi:hypothetical protein
MAGHQVQRIVQEQIDRGNGMTGRQSCIDAESRQVGCAQPIDEPGD